MEKVKDFKSFNNKVLILHGLHGSPANDRIKLLESMGYDPIYPHIDYEKEWVKDKCKSLFLKSSQLAKNCKLIIGISLGGYLAFLLSSNLNINAILINPSLDRSKTKLEITFFDAPIVNSNIPIEIYLGENDTVIPKENTINYLKTIDSNYSLNLIKGMEHRCPINEFKNILNKSKFID